MREKLNDSAAPSSSDAAAAGQPKPRQAALVFIFITVLLDMLALGMIIPVLPQLVVGFLGGDTARGAEIYGIFGTVWALMQFLFSPVLGALSDRFGRRPVILLSNLGMGLDYIVMAWAPSLGWLFLGRIISGITASSISTAYAYIADVTPPEKRAGSFGVLGAAFGVGFVLGPAIGGLLGEYGPRLPFWFAAAFSLANFLYGLLVLPESLPPERRARLSWRRANPIGSLILLRSHRELLGLASVQFLAQLAHVALPSVFVLYANYRYGWGERAVGLTLAGVGICSMIVQAGLVRPIVARLGERRALLIGLIAGAAGFAIFRHLWPGRQRAVVLSRCPRDVLLGPRHAGGAGADDAPGGALRAGTAPGGQQQPDRHCRADRPGALHPDLLRLHRARARLASARRALPAGGASPGRRRGAGPAGHVDGMIHRTSEVSAEARTTVAGSPTVE
jgi:DHA1 family tetracycline resistance protein-like MFS transporter